MVILLCLQSVNNVLLLGVAVMLLTPSTATQGMDLKFTIIYKSISNLGILIF